MSLNCNEINVILGELNLTGFFIQDIIQPGYDSLALYLYKNGSSKTLFICTAQNSCRIHETRRKITRNKKPLRFMECLKSNIKGAKIISAEQLLKSRVIRLNLLCGGAEFFLYIRLWSNAANVILCDRQKKIIDTMFRRPKKNEVTGGTFEEPLSSGEPQREWPVRDFAEFRTEYAATHPEFPELSFNQVIDLWYGEHAERLSVTALLEQAEKWYNEKHTRLCTALERLKAKQAEFSQAERLRHMGDLILSNQTLISSKSTFLECTDYENGSTIRILIDPKKNAHENAAVYYEQYRKAKTGAESLKQDIEITQKNIERLKKQYDTIRTEQNPVKIEQLLRGSTEPKQQQKKTHPGLSYTVSGWYILVGRDANENDELLRRHVRGSDMWLHVRDFPGGYVFIKNRPGKSVPLEILLDAANLAVHYSKARNTTKCDLYYTQVKYLRRAKNGPKGLVIPTQEKNLCITPDKKRIEKLDMLKKEEESL